MIYESRIYKAVPGKLPAINARFANHTIGFFEEFNIGMVGFWNDEIGASNQLTYILSFDSMADREQKWAAFGAHKPWQEVRAETEKDGPLVAQVINSFMSLTPYSPEPSFKTTLHEKRVYEAMPGKLPDLHNRFKDHTMGLFEKHGIENVATGPRMSAPATVWCTCLVIRTWPPGRRAGRASRRTRLGRKPGRRLRRTERWCGCPSTRSCA